jgi:hypothetical protein
MMVSGKEKKILEKKASAIISRALYTSTHGASGWMMTGWHGNE